MTTRKLPEGRVGRFVRMAGVGARAGAGLLLTKNSRATAERAADILGDMRGLAAKVGQMASYVDGFVPDEHRGAYESAMGALRAAAPTSSPEAIRRLVEEELGAPVEDLFDDWEEPPFASASIGQVHRARLADGRRVAVKVQHPGIERAVESDLSNGAVIESMVGAFGGRRFDSKRIYEEVRTRFLEELDYGLEAERQRWFAELHARDPQVVVPEVIGERSSRRVLTTALVEGTTLEEAAGASEDLRADYCRTLWRFVFRGNLVGGMFNADPHPGNYLFQDDGRIAFLDFGCVQPIPDDQRATAVDMHLAAGEGDEARFLEGARRLLGTRGGRYEELMLEHTRRCFDPLFDSPFRMTSAYVSGLVQGLGVMKREVLLDRKSGAVPLPPGMAFMGRLQFGFYSVLARLDAEVDYRALERTFLEPGSTLEPGSALE